VEALDTEMILLLNPDVELQNSVDPLEDACGQQVSVWRRANWWIP